MKAISTNDLAHVAGGIGFVEAVAAKVSFDFMASAFAGGLGSVLMRNTLNFIAQPIFLNPSLIVGVTIGALGGAFSHNVPSMGHNFGSAALVGALSGLASYTTNTTALF